MAISVPMTCYIVSFQLADLARYEALKTRLMAFTSYCPVNATCWAITTDKKAAEVREDLQKVVGPSDNIFVIRSGTEAAWQNAYGQKHTDWLKANL